jgi:hypothetical protein
VLDITQIFKHDRFDAFQFQSFQASKQFRPDVVIRCFGSLAFAPDLISQFSADLLVV